MSIAAASSIKSEAQGGPTPRRSAWREKPLRFLCHLNPTKSEVSHLPAHTEVSFVPMEAVREYGGLDLSQSKTIDSVLQGYTYFRDGDVLIAKITPCFENGKGSLADGLIGGIGFGTTELHVLRCREEIDSRFLFYLTLSHDFRHRGVGWMYGAGGQKRVPEEFLRNFIAPVPPRNEQEEIAVWLDDRTKRIDELVAAKRRLIDLLAEQRMALITKAVTKGLNPNAPMKPSGIEWLGDVPRHWDNWKVFHGFRVVGSGTTPKSDEGDYYDGDVLWVTTTELRETVIMDTIKKLTSQALRDYPTLKTYPPGTLLFAMYGATIGRMGLLGVPATVNQACCALSGGKTLDEKFVYFWLWMRRRELIAMATGGGQPNLSQDDLREVRIPAPSVAEQREIVKYIETRCFGDRGTDRVVASVVSAIEKLIEYRQSLITAAVTGKIDVRGAE